MRQVIKDYFSFNKKERIALVTLIIMIIALWFSPNFFSSLSKNATPNQASFENEQTKLKKKNQSNSEQELKANSDYKEPTTQYVEKSFKSAENNAISLFTFNPNTATVDDWKRLGVKDKTINTITNYLQKGGRFNKPEDLQKIYGMPKETAERLIPFVEIPAAEKKAVLKIADEKNISTSKKAILIDINNSDIEAFESLPGIGEKLSARIVNFREKLGGFVSVQQVRETFGLPDSTFRIILPMLQCNTSTVKKININTADIHMLKAHPYIRYTYGDLIIQYRNTHGNYKSVNELQNIMALPVDAFEKMKPYLTLE